MKELDIDSYELGVNDAFNFVTKNKLPATKKQKQLMRKLGLKIKKDLTINEARIRIGAVLEYKQSYCCSDIDYEDIF